ncbi:hypothetical protein R5R35_008709 [Gryllus longicercus]|uniref:Uncharacterized protein n=1 Tax=Gryllus longicercus TaxID=2509291 RepID=A0AAN9V5B3_9ORTH
MAPLPGVEVERATVRLHEKSAAARPPRACYKVLYETTRDVSAAEELLLGPRAPLPLPPLDACNESNTSDERSDKETESQHSGTVDDEREPKTTT